MIRVKRRSRIVIIIWVILVACSGTRVNEEVGEHVLEDEQTGVINEANSNHPIASEPIDSLTLEAILVDRVEGELDSWESRCGAQEVVNAHEETIPFRLLVGLSGNEDKLIEKDLSVRILDIGKNEETYLSPTGQWLSIRSSLGTISDLEPKITFFSGTTGEENTFVWSDDWIEPLLINPWFTDKFIRMFRLDNINDEPYEVLVSNQGEEIPLIWDDLPDINLDEQYSKARVNTTLSHVLYRTKPELVVTGEPSTTFSNLILWDLGAGKAVWKSPETIHPDLMDPQIAWSPNGKYVIFTATPLADNPLVQDELYFLTLDGEFVRLTNFSTTFEGYFFSDLAWSPDNGKILFTFNDTNKINNDERFRFPLVYDLMSNSLWDFCLTTGYEAENPWSPDSQLLGIISAVNNTERKLLIVDITSGDIFVLPFDVCVAGGCEPSDEFGLTKIIGWLPEDFTLFEDNITLDK